jgi:hypothetical protein
LAVNPDESMNEAVISPYMNQISYVFTRPPFALDGRLVQGVFKHLNDWIGENY